MRLLLVVRVGTTSSPALDLQQRADTSRRARSPGPRPLTPLPPPRPRARCNQLLTVRCPCPARTTRWRGGATRAAHQRGRRSKGARRKGSSSRLSSVACPAQGGGWGRGAGAWRALPIVSQPVLKPTCVSSTSRASPCMDATMNTRRRRLGNPNATRCRGARTLTQGAWATGSAGVRARTRSHAVLTTRHATLWYPSWRNWLTRYCGVRCGAHSQRLRAHWHARWRAHLHHRWLAPVAVQQRLDVLHQYPWHGAPVVDGLLQQRACVCMCSKAREDSLRPRAPCAPAAGGTHGAQARCSGRRARGAAQHERRRRMGIRLPAARSPAVVVCEGGAGGGLSTPARARVVGGRRPTRAPRAPPRAW